ncbi:uncharacterized protein BX664DRAFT_289331 [Halteromyces radiatus]|uniref:uncharacterized protein n=1 Tax=Halteromyces radiatus TaxID=101107 RepID=UPI0022211277|nr:uncharacterized protein BX664DRAFT_289331 [Halteromyces radiatus]KAI8099295.1 hypothetical protein BX664DRAFT_289331 [Halteromyces radiatus]
MAAPSGETASSGVEVTHSPTVTAATTTSTTTSTRPSPTSNVHRMNTPASPSYPPYGYIDPNMVYEIQPNGYDPNDTQQQQQQQQQPGQQQTYVFYPVSPQFYYSDYQSYPGSPALHPQSPPMNPTSPPFSPTFQYQGVINSTGSVTLSPTSHATYVLPPHSVHPPFPPLHISSPVLTGTPVGSPPPHHQMVALPGPYHHLPSSHHQHQQQQQQQQQQQYERKRQPQQSQQQRNHTGEHSYNQQATQEELSMNYHPQNVYVRGLSSSTTDESFLELCKAYGPVTSSKAILDQKSGECKGYGFALFEKEQDCHTAIEGLNNAGLQASFARVGQVSFSSRLRNLQDETSTNIYISNLPLDMTEQKLEELFQPFQTVSNRILRDPQSGLSRGVGFARMSDRLAAVSIIERFNGHVVAGSSAPLQVRFADSPAQKRLKNQTSRKRMIRSREFQPMAGFPVRHMMPITPETMLGINPLNPSSSTPVAYQTTTTTETETATSATKDTVKDQDLIHLTNSVEQELKITESDLDKKDNTTEQVQS